MKTIRIIHGWVLLLSVWSIAVVSCKKKEVDHPNIIIILADDLGYGDPQVYHPGSKIPTPHINRMASEGIRFTDAHTPSSVCTPTRYGILTGRYAWRTSLKQSVLWAWDKPLISPDQLTLPKMLKKMNYNTACIGKWHLGWRWPSIGHDGYVNDTIEIGNYQLKGRNELWKNIDFSKPIGGGPLEAGFDYYFGDDVPNFAPYGFIENDKMVRIPELIKPDTMYGGQGPMVEGWKLESVMPTITQKAVDYIKSQSDQHEPFFLYFSLTAPHTPIAPVDAFKGKSRAGAYGDYVNEVDWSVGEIIEALRSTGQFENSIVVFTSDNGSPQRDGHKMGGQLGSVKKYGHDPSHPWRGLKADIWEGGHRVPFIMSWPGHIQANKVNDQLICLTDLMATFSGLIGFDRQEVHAEDSHDFSGTLLGVHDNTNQRTSIVHHSIDGTFAFREGSWKLILGRDSGGFSKNLKIKGIPVATNGQLYHLKDDPEENDNLYGEYPKKVTEMTRKLSKIKHNQ